MQRTSDGKAGPRFEEDGARLFGCALFLCSAEKHNAGILRYAQNDNPFRVGEYG
jgi:hypothetical protein